MARTHPRYGWLPDLPDARDRYLLRAVYPIVLPPAVSLQVGCPAVYDQGNLGSCTAQAIAAALDYDRIKQGAEEQTPSRLFIYYNERVLIGTVESDSGAMIRDGIKTVVKLGAPPEAEWPYLIERFAELPSADAYTHGLDHQALVYRRVRQTRDDLRGCLAAGFPVIFGISVYDSFEDNDVARTGTVPLPDLTVERQLGGHAILLVGYDDATSRYAFRNSWGEGWGDVGYGTLPYAYVEDRDLADDFWMITKIEVG